MLCALEVSQPKYLMVINCLFYLDYSLVHIRYPHNIEIVRKNTIVGMLS